MASPDRDASGELVAWIARRANYLATRMIWEANHRTDADEGDPKVGGHPGACASCVHIQTVFHLRVREPQDWFAMKPHASPVDHSLHAMLGMFRKNDGDGWMDESQCKQVLRRLRKFPTDAEPEVFQSYHADTDPDSWSSFPAGSVGIPPVVAGYSALAFRYARDHGFDVAQGAHFWALMGDSEFREGSLPEAMPDLAEREVSNLTWIVDFNRQSLDGMRTTNAEVLGGSDAHRLEAMARANGWDVVQLRHGSRRLTSEALCAAFENLDDYETQALLYARDGREVRKRLLAIDSALTTVLDEQSDDDVYGLLADLGGHDVRLIERALLETKKTPRPTLVIAHTIKGWGLQMAAAPGNHSALPDDAEVEALREAEGLDADQPFGFFADQSPERSLLDARGAHLRGGIEKLWAARDQRRARMSADTAARIPEQIRVSLDLLPKVHTQYVWGQLIAKLTRLGSGAADLADDDQRWSQAGAHVLTLAPDVGTSTNINPVMDAKVYGPEPDEDFEETLSATQRGRPLLTPRRDASSRHLRFEIAEANAMCAAGAFGRMEHMTGVPLLPCMTIYDFFIKRCLDQLYYQLYWGSSFILVGTPSGITLAPEGAQHSWKSDIQMPNLITWEPAFGVEVDWILSDAVKRHFTGDNAGRSGVLLRCHTRAVPQKLMLERLRAQRRFAGADPQAILTAIRSHSLAGGWYLIDRRGEDGYLPGENVVHLFTMGALVPEAVAAADELARSGVYANVIVVSSPELLLGALAHANDYRHLREGLGINSDLHLTSSHRGDRAGLVVAAGARIPVVSVHDGEAGLLDNIGSIVGVKQTALAVRKASKCGRPRDVYRYQGMDTEAVVAATWRALETTASEEIQVESSALEQVARERAKRVSP